MKLQHFVYAALLTATTIPSARAELIVGGHLFQYLSLGQPNVTDGTEQRITTESGPVEVSDSRTKSGLGISGSYFAYADYGVVRIKTVATGRSDGYAAGAGAFAHANDFITVSGAPEGAILKAVIALEGSGNDTGRESSAFVGGNWMGFAGNTCAAPLGRLSGSVSVLCESAVQVENGQSYLLAMNLDGSSESQGATMVLDFSHTARVQSLAVFDSTGNMLNDVTIQAASGTVYPTASAVPEPSSFALVGLVLACAVYRRVGMRGEL